MANKAALIAAGCGIAFLLGLAGLGACVLFTVKEAADQAVEEQSRREDSQKEPKPLKEQFQVGYWAYQVEDYDWNESVDFGFRRERAGAFFLRVLLNPGVPKAAVVVFDVPRQDYWLVLSGGFMSSETAKVRIEASKRSNIPGIKR